MYDTIDDITKTQCTVNDQNTVEQSVYMNIVVYTYIPTSVEKCRENIVLVFSVPDPVQIYMESLKAHISMSLCVIFIILWWNSVFWHGLYY